MRIFGHGYDVHRLVEDRKLILGGVEIPFEKGLLGHSDADGCCAVAGCRAGCRRRWGHRSAFPTTTPAYKGADSLAADPRSSENYRRSRLQGGQHRCDDCLIAAEAGPPHPRNARKIADAFGLPVDAVSVKATTEEHLGFTGEGLGIGRPRRY